MVQTNNLTSQSIFTPALGKRMLIGAIPALILISLFVFTADNPNPEWGRFWMIRPLIIVPLAGAGGGLFYHLMDRFSSRGSMPKALAIVLSLVVYIIGLWLGIVLGLDGTYWD